MEKISADKIRDAIISSGDAQASALAHIFVEDSLASTNSTALEMLKGGVELPFALLALNQSAGRGRLGRSWFCAGDGRSICMSVAAEIPRGTNAAESFTVRAGLAACENLSKLCGTDFYLKWPNDIWTEDGRKICGMLAELDISPDGARRVIFGIGANFDLTGLPIPPELSGKIADISSVSEKKVSINSVCALFARSVLSASITMNDESLAKRFSRYDFLRGRRIMVEVGSEKLCGVACGIDENGHLLLRLSDSSLRSISGGEASVSKSHLD